MDEASPQIYEGMQYCLERFASLIGTLKSDQQDLISGGNFEHFQRDLLAQYVPAV